MAQEETYNALDDIELDIIRDTTPGVDPLNRYCMRPGSTDILYYCEVNGDKLTIHRGDKSGKWIASTVPCLAHKGDTDIHFVNPDHTMTLDHEHYEFPLMHTITRFKADGVKYHWRSHIELVTDDGETVLATFKPTWLEGKGHKVGQLVISPEGKDIMDVIVVTSFIVQERADEHKLAAKMAKEHAEKTGVGPL